MRTINIDSITRRTVLRPDFLSLLLVGALLLAGCGDDTPSHTGTDAAATAAPAGADDHVEGETHQEDDVVRLADSELEEFGIEVRTAGPGEMRVEKTYPGEIRVNEDRFAHVTPRVAGVVRSVQAALGQPVQAGAVMAVLESRELADLKSDYLASRERLALAQSGFEREERLFEKKISSEQEYLEARQALAEARIALRSATQKLRALGFSAAYIDRLPQEDEAVLTRYPLTAPFDGTVIEKHIVRGEALEADAEAFEVADLSTVWADLSIYQKDMGLIIEGQTVVISSGGRGDRGEIIYVRPIVGEDTRTALARVVLANRHGRWKPGMFVNGLVSVEASEAAVVIPRSALQTLGEETVVFVQTEEGFVPRPVTVAAEDSDRVAVASGLAAGERYVAAGAFALKSQIQKGEMSGGHAH